VKITKIAIAAGVAGLALGIGACGGAASHPAAARSHPAVKSPVSSPETVTSPAASLVSANERLFADAMAASIPVIPARSIAGPMMRAYARFQHALGAAWGAAGQPAADESVAKIAGGFKLCDQSSDCFAYTQFTTNHAGQVTGVSVNGQPVAGRMATAPAVTSGGLTISDVAAYRLTSAQNLVAVAFKLTDSGYRPINTSPALLASFSGASNDSENDALPATLRPGDSLYTAAYFDITQITGQFCLQPNDGFGEQLPCTILHKVTG